MNKILSEERVIRETLNLINHPPTHLPTPWQKMGDAILLGKGLDFFTISTYHASIELSRKVAGDLRQTLEEWLGE